MTARIFAERKLAGDAIAQRALLTETDAKAISLAPVEASEMLTSEPTLSARVDSVHRSGRFRDTVRVEVYVSLPNLRGLPAQTMKEKVADDGFLQSRPRITAVDTITTVRESRSWRVSVDAAFRLDEIRLLKEAFAYDSSVGFRRGAIDRIVSYYRDRGRSLPPILEASATNLRVAEAYADSLEITGMVRRNPIYPPEPTLGTHVILGRVHNLSHSTIRELRLITMIAQERVKMTPVFDIPAGGTKEIFEFGIFNDGVVAFEVADVKVAVFM